MTSSISIKLTVAGLLALSLMLPTLSFAATPTSGELETQYQMLKSRLDEMKVKHSENASSTDKSKEREAKASTTIDRTCMAAAVTTREASIKTAWVAFTDSITSALDTRATNLTAAWNASEAGSRDAIKKAWDTWKNERKAASTKLKNERKAAWDTFKATAKSSCKVTTPKEEGLEKSSSDSIAL